MESSEEGRGEECSCCEEQEVPVVSVMLRVVQQSPKKVWLYAGALLVFTLMYFFLGSLLPSLALR